MLRLKLASTVAMAGLAGAANAGAIDRSGQSTDILYEAGNYFRTTYGAVYPDISGVQAMPILGVPPGGNSGNVVPDYDVVSFSYKHDFGNGFEAAVVYDEPFGAIIEYMDSAPYFAATATAELDTNALTALLKYTFPSKVSVFGGLRYQTLSADVSIPYASTPTSPPLVVGAIASLYPEVVAPGEDYLASGKENHAYGYVVAVGYEIPDIALRVSLTYNSAIDFDIETRESSALGTGTSTTEVTTPQSVNLEFQTGIAPDTLLFGGVRWVDWTQFDITPRDYKRLTGILADLAAGDLGGGREGQALVEYDDDYWTYSIGVGRAFTEAFSGAVSLTYEPQTGGFASNLGPTDGLVSLGLGGTYKYEGWEFGAGVRYTWLDNTQTSVITGKAGDFDDNDVVSVGLEVAYRF